MTWNQLITYVLKLLKMEQKVDKNSTDIEKLQTQVETLTYDLKSLKTEFQQYRENAERDRREMVLQLQVVLLQHGVNVKPELLLKDTDKAELRKENETLREQNGALREQLEAKNADENEAE